MNAFLKLRLAIIIYSLLLFSQCSKDSPKPLTPPVVTTASVTKVSVSSATSGGTVTATAGITILERGVCFAAHHNPSGDVDPYVSSGDGVGNFESIITGFALDATYYVRAYAFYGDKSNPQVAFGNEVSFSVAGVNTDAVGDITGTSAYMGGTVTSDIDLIARGVCWNTSPAPTTDNNKTNDGTVTGHIGGTITGLTLNTTYYVRAYAINKYGTFYGEELSFMTLNIPQLTTKEIGNPNTFIATSGGDIISNGGSFVTAWGICWSTTPLPTTDNSKTTGNYGTNVFYGDVTGTVPNTTYYVRAYATNVVGTGYGNEISFTTPTAALTDIDGNPYTTVAIGTQLWQLENLRTTKFSNGDNIPNLTINPLPYGNLYDWTIASDARNVCPSGWHLPGDDEWTQLEVFLGGIDIAGGKMKEKGDAHWWSSNRGDNSSGFTAVPAGGDGTFNGESYLSGNSGIFWTSTELDSQSAFGHIMAWSSLNVIRYGIDKRYRFSIRCLKD